MHVCSTLSLARWLVEPARRLPLALTLVPVVALPSWGVPPASHVSGPERLAVAAWLDADSVTQGEPVILNYRITNRNGSPVVLNLINEEGWLQLALTDASGTPIPRQRDLFMARAGGYANTRPVLAPLLPAGESYRDEIVLTRRYVVLRPGAYRLSLDISIPFVRGGQPMAGVIRKSRTLSFTVRPPEPARLRVAAEALLKKASGNGPARGRGVAVEALLALPVEESRPAALALVRQGPEDAVRHAIDEAVRRNSADGVDLLADIAWDTARPTALRSRARAGLLNLWWNGAPDVRGQTEKAFLLRDGRLPQTTSPPVLM